MINLELFTNTIKRSINVFEILSIEGPQLSLDKLLGVYYSEGDILIKANTGGWYITNGKSTDPITWDPINASDFHGVKAAMDVIVRRSNMIEISDNVKIAGVSEVWYDK